MLRFWKMTSVRVILVIAVLLAVYAIAGFIVAPKLVRSALLKDIPENLDATPAVGAIRINPFLLQVTVDEFLLTGRGGEKLLGFERLFVDFELSSIWHRAYSFGNIDVTSPYVNVLVAQDGSLNLARLKPHAAAQEKSPEKSAPLPAVRIGSLKVSQGAVSYEDHSQPDVFAARLEPINFELREFTTGVEGGKFTFTAASKLGERFEWHGHVSVQPIESDGEFRIDGLRAHTLWEYLEDKLNFAVPSGTLDLAATYKFSAGNADAGGAAGTPANLQLDVSKAALTDLTVRPKGSETDWITVPGLTVGGATVDLAKRQAHVDRVSLTGIKLTAWRESDGSINLLKLAAAPGAPPAAAATISPGAPGATPAVTTPVPPAAALPPWTFDLRQFDIREASIAAEDRTTQPAVKVLLAPFDLQVTGASQNLSKPVAIKLETHINEKGFLSVNGDVVPQPAIADLSLKLADVDLTAIQPYLAEYSSLTLLGGKLGGNAKLHYGAQKNSPALQLSGEISVDKLHTVDNTLHDDFINWDRLDIVGLNVSQSPDRLDIEQIVAHKPYARVIIESDASINVKRVLAVPGSAAAVPASPPPAKPSASAQRAAAAAVPPPAPGMPMSIKKIIVEAGQANFTDLSVTPNFSTGIQTLQGTITGLSSKPISRAKMDLHGSVGEYAPVSITGEFNVLGPKLFTDIAMSFRNIELSIFNPYSGKFAGYNITKGKLTAEMTYKVDGRKLDAQHHIIIEQLEFGDKTASKEAVSLPIKLAVSLLKDRNGVIDLPLPITGSLDDPEFKVGPIIWKVLVNILEKAVTAPFALLGSLFGGGPDIQFIDFQPGQSTLDAGAADKVKTVAKALIERPQLKIEVPIAVVPELDRPALVAARYAAELGAAQTAKGSPKKAASGASGALPAFDLLDTATQLEVLTRLYLKDTGAEPKYPDAVTGSASKADVAAAKLDFLGKGIRDHIQVGESDLQALGQQRALALQQMLLADAQVTADRVFLVANDKATSKDGVIRLELSLQ